MQPVLDRHSIRVDGRSIDFGEGPDNGPPLVFLHGFPGAWDGYRAVYPLLVDGFHVLAPTLRGMGKSSRAPTYTMSGWIDDVEAFIRHACRPPVYGVGHSAGAWFGLAAAARAPELFSGFASLDQPLDPEDHLIYHEGRQPTITAMVAAMRQARNVDHLADLFGELPASSGGTWADHLTAEEIREEAEEMKEHDPEILGAWADRSLEEFILVPELQVWPGGYRGPVMFIDGDPEAGSMVTPRAAHYNMAKYPWASQVRFEGRDHSLGLYTDPAPVVDEIRRFFADV